MNTRTIVTLFVGAVVMFYIATVIDSRHKAQSSTSASALAVSAADASSAPESGQAATPGGAPAPEGPATLAAVGAASESTVTLGSAVPDSRYRFEVVFSSKGASIKTVTLSQFRDHLDKKKQLVLLSPVKPVQGDEALSMATGTFAMLDQKIALPLAQLDWFAGEPVISDDGSQSVTFTASVKQPDSGSIIEIVKKYTIRPDQYHIECDIAVSNLSAYSYKTRFDMHGPVGIGKESIQQDIRKLVAAYRDLKGQIVTTRLDINKVKDGLVVEPANAQDRFIWAAVMNKYFAAIVVPLPEGGDTPAWVFRLTASHHAMDPKIDREGSLSFAMRTTTIDLAPADQPGSRQTRRFLIYFGPKDKSFFDSVPLYRELGFLQTIDFMSCCCPAALIHPIAFGILAAMKWAYAFIPDYGIIIIIFVLLVRLVLHPITKRSQVSMMKMSKLGPKAEEIKKQYADDKQEMNRRLMALYKEAGISPFMGMLPMFLQMPIWIALYGAIYSSIALRGQPFHLLWFWISDLSAPDAVLSWTPVALPLVGVFSSLNILPILLAIGMYLQQKLTPQPTAQTSEAMAQQQKIMLIMMPVMMLVFLYNAPSGLNLYIMASTFAGVIEQKVIRKHIREREALEEQGLVPATAKTGGKAKKKKPKPFFRY